MQLEQLLEQGAIRRETTTSGAGVTSLISDSERASAEVPSKLETSRLANVVSFSCIRAF
jgi:hypothetical protein